MYLDYLILTKRLALLNHLNSISKWFSAVICNVSLRSGQFSELKTQIPTDICVSSQVWIQRWCSRNTTSRFQISWLICSFTFSKDLRQDLLRNQLLLAINIISSHSSARPQLSDLTSRKLLSFLMNMASNKNHFKIYLLLTSNNLGAL